MDAIIHQPLLRCCCNYWVEGIPHRQGKSCTHPLVRLSANMISTGSISCHLSYFLPPNMAILVIVVWVIESGWHLSWFSFGLNPVAAIETSWAAFFFARWPQKPITQPKVQPVFGQYPQQGALKLANKSPCNNLSSETMQYDMQHHG